MGGLRKTVNLKKCENLVFSRGGVTCTITPESSGDTTFTAYVVDADGNIISEEYSQTMTSNAGFFQKIIAFFKGIFGLTKIISETVKFKFRLNI